MSSSRPQTSNPFSPPKTPTVTATPKKAAGREPAPFVLVPDSLVSDDDKDLEPHWREAIDTATD